MGNIENERYKITTGELEELQNVYDMVNALKNQGNEELMPLSQLLKIFIQRVDTE